MNKLVFLFSGQGSQYPKMGETLYEKFPVFARSLEQSDTFIQQQIGQSIIEALYHNKNEKLDDLLLSHPAIVAIELAILDLMQYLEIIPDYVAGNSLGEFAAGVAGGIWSKEMALEAAIEQAKSIVQAGVEGGMLAVMHELTGDLKVLLAKHKLHLASKNFAEHYTFSGERKHINAAQKELERLDISSLKLAVNYPFHSPLIEAAKADFTYYTYTASQLNNPSKKFISGLSSGALKEDIPHDYFWKAISQTSNFSHLIQHFESLGPCLYLDLGPSGTSSTFAKYNLSKDSKSVTFPIMSPYKREIKQIELLKNLLKTSI